MNINNIEKISKKIERYIHDPYTIELLKQHIRWRKILIEELQKTEELPKDELIIEYTNKEFKIETCITKDTITYHEKYKDINENYTTYKIIDKYVYCQCCYKYLEIPQIHSDFGQIVYKLEFEDNQYKAYIKLHTTCCEPLFCTHPFYFVIEKWKKLTNTINTIDSAISFPIHNIIIKKDNRFFPIFLYEVEWKIYKENIKEIQEINKVEKEIKKKGGDVKWNQ